MSAGKTISEKILSAKSATDARAGDLVVAAVDAVLGTDASGPMAIDYFRQMGGEELFDPARVIFALDHYAPAPTAASAVLLDITRDFCRRTGALIYEVGEGIGHQLIVEKGHARPGGLVVGADSHAVTYGALNAFATGIGSSDLAAAMISGRIWLRVPESIRVSFSGALMPGVQAKDIALHLCGRLGADGAAYKALEFDGPGAAALDLEERLVVANMAVEMGAKNGIFATDAETEGYLAGRADGPFDGVVADADAVYVGELALALGALVPQVARPHLVDNVVDITETLGQPVDMVYLGTCTGGRAGDFRQARDVLKAGGGPASGVRLVVTPASASVERELTEDGTFADLQAMGAILQMPGCGSCCGTCGVGLGDGERVISTANRNFKGRMGNPKAAIFLASPLTCAASAVAGRIADPRQVSS